jgi:hypothetical protein
MSVSLERALPGRWGRLCTTYIKHCMHPSAEHCTVQTGPHTYSLFVCSTLVATLVHTKAAQSTV